jgi:hypothetical protein
MFYALDGALSAPEAGACPPSASLIAKHPMSPPIGSLHLKVAEFSLNRKVNAEKRGKENGKISYVD